MKKQFIISLMLLSGTALQAQVNQGSVFSFTYDTSGNQNLRKIAEPERNLASEALETKAPIANELLELPREALENAFSVSPNPTSGEVTLQWKPEMTAYIADIELVSLVTSERAALTKPKGNSMGASLFGKPSGLYLVIFHLNNEKVKAVQKKIIKM